METYSSYLSISEKPAIWFCRANSPLQNLLHHISPECNHCEICESTVRYVLIYFTVFSILSIASSFLNELWNFFIKIISEKALRSLIRKKIFWILCDFFVDYPWNHIATFSQKKYWKVIFENLCISVLSVYFITS